MKIIGGQDYYDGAGYGVDETIIFVRKSQEMIDTPFSLAPSIAAARSRSSTKLHFMLIACGGELHPVVHEYKDQWGWGHTLDPEINRYHYDAQSAYDALERSRKEEATGLFTSDFDRPEDKITNHFRRTPPQAWINWLIENKVVTGIVERQEAFDTFRASGKCRIKANEDNLKSVEFYRKLDPATTHMRIANYIGGVLPGGTETIELSDNSKIVKAGFDTKSSFRTPKGTKKPRRGRG
jgi:hypothetical protein